MTLDITNLDDIMVSILENPSKKNLEKLLGVLATAGNPIPNEAIEQLDLLWESWENDEFDGDKGHFCLELTKLPMTDSALFRKQLVEAVKTVLPPYLTRNPVLKAIGVRNENVALNEIAYRVEKLQKIKLGMIVFLPGSSRWGIAGNIDNINANIAIDSFEKIGTSSLPLEQILKDAVFLENSIETKKLIIQSRTRISSSEYRAIVIRKASQAPSENIVKQMAQCGCCASMDATAFNSYWNDLSASPVQNSNSRRSCNGRSLKEIELLLKSEQNENATPFTADEAALFAKFFTALRVDTAYREAKLVAEISAEISSRIEDNSLLEEVFTPLLGKVPYWPEDPENALLPLLSVWGEISAKAMEKFAKLCSKIFPEDYLVKCLMRVPLKAVNQLGLYIDDELIYDHFYEVRSCGADLLLWIWKNRKKHSAELLQMVNVDNVIRALLRDDLPKAWTSSIRELRELLMNNAEFQKQILLSVDDNVMAFAATLQGAIFLSPGERQSLMVKLSRSSESLRDYLENGAGRRILQAGGGSNKGETVDNSNEPNYSSVKSNKALLKELNDIISIHVPENREALKVARAHGDFRENSEFDAAKERRNFLSRRRSELERELANLQPLNMANVKVEDTVVIGCEAFLKYEDGSEDKYYVLGAWDGNPERGFLSYKTKLGTALYNHKVGTEISLPDGRKCTVTKVASLPQEIIAELDEQ